MAAASQRLLPAAARRSFLLLLGSLMLSLVAVQREARALDKQFEDALAAKIEEFVCADGGNWLRCYNLEPSSCKSVAAGFVQPCVKAALAKQATVMTEEEGAAAAKKMMNCFNENFLSSYGSGKRLSAECQKPPQHLQDPSR